MLIRLTYTNYQPPPADGDRAQRTTFDWLATLQLNALIAIGVFSLLLATNQIPLSTASLIQALFTTIIYTFCIGTPTFYLIIQFIEPMPVRGEVIAWSLVILSCMSLAVLGALIAETILQ